MVFGVVGGVGDVWVKWGFCFELFGGDGIRFVGGASRLVNFLKSLAPFFGWMKTFDQETLGG